MDKSTPYGEWKAFGIAVGGILLVQHVIENGDLPVLVGDLPQVHVSTMSEILRRTTHDRELDIGGPSLGSKLIDVHDPFVVVLEAVGGDSDDFDVARGKVFGSACNLAELGRADGREVARVREQDSPRVANPLVELDRTGGCLGFEVRGDVTEAKGRHFYECEGDGRGEACGVGLVNM